MFKHHDFFKEFISDWDRLFNNKLIKKLCKETDVIYNFLTFYYL